MSTYLFYDLETTGLNKCFDQILQFAAIRTDMNFNELERYTTYIQLRPDVIYSPGAMITNRISIFESMSGLCEYEAIKEIHRLLNQPGTISLGYNSLKFDDEFLRFSFHRNLFPPYTHQYADGCYRMDILPVTACYFLFKNDIMKWPEIDGAPTLKLEHLSEANRLARGPAHNALVDVEATIALARLLAEEEDMWKYLTGYFQKKEDMRRLAVLPPFFGDDGSIGSETESWGLVIGTRYGYERRYQIPVLSLGSSIPYSNQTLWLRLDNPGLRETTLETIEESTWVVRKKYGEADFILPPSKRFLANLDAERLAIVDENREWLRENRGILSAIVDYYRSYEYPEIPDLDADAALYQMGFPDPSDQNLCSRFHSALPKDRARFIEQFKKPEYKILAGRILCRNAPSNCEPSVLEAFEHRRLRSILEGDEPLVDYKGEVQGSYSDALDEIDEIRSERTLDEEQLQLLDELETYLKSGLKGGG
ncbi:MAG: exonuclease domain-containing protein [bacterium]|nr:exonuclease domain-containing protein [bacterium]